MAKPRTPTNLLVLRGGLKNRPARAAKRAGEPEPNGPIGNAPKHLTPEQKQAWDDIVSTCHEGVLCAADRLYVEYGATVLAQVRKEGAKNPRLGTRLEMVLTRLGMTPADRSRVSAVKPRTPSPIDEFRRNP